MPSKNRNATPYACHCTPYVYLSTILNGVYLDFVLPMRTYRATFSRFCTPYVYTYLDICHVYPLFKDDLSIEKGVQTPAQKFDFSTRIQREVRHWPGFGIGKTTTELTNGESRQESKLAEKHRNWPSMKIIYIVFYTKII